MRQQTKPFIVERKPSRKPKSGDAKPSIWGKLDLSLHQGRNEEPELSPQPATGGNDDRR
jgi:hypothetical protein